MFEEVPGSELPEKMRNRVAYKMYNFVTFGIPPKLDRIGLESYRISLVVGTLF